MRLSRPFAGAVARPFRRGMARGSSVLAAGALIVTGLSGAAQATGSAGPIYVAMGDSYTSGPLIPRSPAGSPAGCFRSTRDYPALVASNVGAASFANVSCQGATSGNVTAPEKVPLGTNPPEINALSSRTTLVTLGIGGNDINFLSIVLKCSELSVTDPFGAPCMKHYTRGGTDQLKQIIAAAAPKVAAALRAIHSRAPSAEVLLVGYPDILPNTGTGCFPREPFAHGDVPYLRGVEIELNQMLASVAAANDATYVNTYTASIGHDICQRTGVKWIEGVIPTSPAAPFHPNALGEKAMAAQVEAATR